MGGRLDGRALEQTCTGHGRLIVQWLQPAMPGPTNHRFRNDAVHGNSIFPADRIRKPLAEQDLAAQTRPKHSSHRCILIGRVRIKVSVPGTGRWQPCWGDGPSPGAAQAAARGPLAPAHEMGMPCRVLVRSSQPPHIVFSRCWVSAAAAIHSLPDLSQTGLPPWNTPTHENLVWPVRSRARVMKRSLCVADDRMTGGHRLEVVEHLVPPGEEPELELAGDPAAIGRGQPVGEAGVIGLPRGQLAEDPEPVLTGPLIQGMLPSSKSRRLTCSSSPGHPGTRDWTRR